MGHDYTFVFREASSGPVSAVTVWDRFKVAWTPTLNCMLKGWEDMSIPAEAGDRHHLPKSKKSPLWGHKFKKVKNIIFAL
jgi:hypothetical protein